VVLDEFQPTLWCVASTLAQEELPRDRSVLRTTAPYHSGCLGSTPRSGTQVSSVSVIKSSPTVQEWPNRPVGSPVVP
jgi:hypothetical protein